jgi:EAL and modified HD-GYP domain-containing signal transduction protein
VTAGIAGSVGRGTGASAHVARQPIYNADQRLFGYELLFRRAATSVGAGVTQEDDDSATTSTILAAFSEFGADQLLGGRPGFINLTRAFIVGDLPLPFAPEAAVLEVLETVKLDAEVVAGATALAEQGYRLALDDFVWTPESEPLLEIAAIAKIDVLALTWAEVEFTAERCRRHNLQLLAEKVEDAAMLQRCRDAGFELFQGYHLGRPETMTIETLSPGQALALELVGRLGDPSTTTQEIEDSVRRDPALVYRLLRIANSAASGAKRQVSTIRDALVMVGMSRLRAWLVLLALSSKGAGETGIVDALARARTCERVARGTGLVSPDVAFTAGLLHGVAESLGLPPNAMLERIPSLTADIADALNNRPGPLTDVLTAVVAYEQKDLAVMTNRQIPLNTLAEAYLAALAWTTETTAQTGE